MSLQLSLVLALGPLATEPTVPPPSLEPEPRSVTPAPERRPARPLPHRLSPRWVELVGLSLGLGFVVAGGILAGLDGHCASGGPAEREPHCEVVWVNAPQSYALLSLGGVLAAGWGALIIVDEVRVGRARGRQATLSWTLRF